MAKGPEAKLKAECRAWMRFIGAYVFSPVQMGYGAATVDDLVCLKGKFVALEYKAEGKNPTPRQETTMQEISRAGGFVRCIWSLDDLQSELKSLR